MTDPRAIRIAEHSYELPEERIAQRPLAERDATKLLVFDGRGIRDRTFRDLPQELPPGTLLVLNDTRVVHARVRFQRSTGAVIECMLLDPEGRPMEEALRDRGTSRWWCMVGNAKRWKGERLELGEGADAFAATRVAERDGEHLVQFDWSGRAPLLAMLDRWGTVPLPPYMRRAAERDDEARYNTVFADRPGSVAAPTASLHFTRELLEALTARGVDMTRVTLHVGAGTFLPVKSDTMGGHAMHAEQVRIPVAAVRALLERAGQGPVMPVGTTALRTIESLYWHGADLALGLGGSELAVDQWRPYEDHATVRPTDALNAVLRRLERDGTDEVVGVTRLLIAPGYRFQLADGLITNFHQPQSTLLLLVSALIGERWREVYAHALAHGYRFLSYGDGSLLWRDGR